jgi:proteasome lid subunit RPN8/RPN11
MRIAIARRVLDQILGHAAVSPDREVCGLLFGDSGEISEARPAPNIAVDPARTFELDPRALLAAMKAERAGGPKIIGHYHSHPNGSAEPSERDAAAAEPGSYWMIVATGKAELWMAEEGERFRAVMLEVRHPHESRDPRTRLRGR